MVCELAFILIWIYSATGLCGYQKHKVYKEKKLGLVETEVFKVKNLEEPTHLYSVAWSGGEEQGGGQSDKKS